MNRDELVKSRASTRGETPRPTAAMTLDELLQLPAYVLDES